MPQSLHRVESGDTCGNAKKRLHLLARMSRRASNAANQANADPPPSYRASGHPATKAVMQRHMETINRLESDGKALQQDVDTLFTLFYGHDTLPPRPTGIQEGENWDDVDPMKLLGQPVGERFVRADYAGYIVGFDYRRAGGSYLVRYEDGDRLPFPARELDTFQSSMFTCRTAPLLQSAHRSTGMCCCLQVSIQFPMRMLLQSTRQEVSISLSNCLGKIASLNFVTTVCQLLCQRATHTA